MMEIIPYNINIMNEKGIIIGSGDVKRLNTVHQRCHRSSFKKKMIEINKPYKGSKAWS